MKSIKKFLLVIVLFLSVLFLSSCDLILGNNNDDDNDDPDAIYCVVFDFEDFQEVNSGEKATKPSNPTREGYNFIGWYLGDDLFDFNTPIKKDIELISMWEVKKLNVKFMDGETLLDTIEVEYGSYVTPPIPTSSKEFLFWGEKGSLESFDFNSQITKNITLYANYEGDVFTVTFVNGKEESTVNVENNSKVTAPKDPKSEGYTFDGWYINDTKFDFNTLVTSNVTLTAKFVPAVYTINFVVDSNKTSQEVGYNQKAIEPATPTKEGYKFLGWYASGEFFDFNTPITKGFTLYAKFEVIKLNVSYNVEGTISTQKVNYNSKLTKPADPSKSGYKFDGWFVGNKLYDFNSKVTADIVLVAKFSVDTENYIYVNYDFGYECFETKDDLRVAYYTDFYNFLQSRNCNFATYGITDLASFLVFMDTWTYAGRSEMGSIGTAFGNYYLTRDLKGNPSGQPETTFIGWCYKNGKYLDFIDHLMVFFEYWRTDEGYSQTDPNGNDFFASAWASMVDTAKFFHFTGDNLQDTYSWFDSERVHYALDHIPGVGYVTLEYKSKTPITLPTDVTRPGYTFLGWFDSNNKAVTVVNQSMTVYAHWQKNN